MPDGRLTICTSVPRFSALDGGKSEDKNVTQTCVTLYTVGDWHPADSYGQIACKLTVELTNLGVDVNAFSLGKRFLPVQDEATQAITTRPLVPAIGGIAMGWPTHFAKFPDTLFTPRNGCVASKWQGPSIALTMFESSKLPPGWCEVLNRFDAVVVPSRFCHEVFGQSGVTVPIHVVPLGVSDVYTFQKRNPGPPLTFLAFLDRGERKGGITALQAFLRAFGEDMNYRLILKGRKAEAGRAFALTNPNIEVIQADMSERELAALFGCCHVLINPHRGEGFGMIPRQFSATGGLALTTGWSGTADEIEQWGMALPYRLERAGWRGNRGLEGEDVGDWATVDVMQLTAMLVQVANHWQEHQQKLPQRAAAARRLYQWPRMAKQVLEIWQKVHARAELYPARQVV
jgi:glycosyltransferase involved in cell wall biosynthesis